MNIHKIQSDNHFNFLQENRQDPITGDLISDGDEVVFCADCKSAFLKDTWEYLGKTHCNQSETLADFPVRKVLELRILKDVNSLLFPLKGTENETFESFESKLDNLFWKKIDVHLRINEQTQIQMSNSNSPVFEDGKSVVYVLMGLMVFVCILIGIFVDLSDQAYIFLFAVIAGTVLLPLIYLQDEAGNATSISVFPNMRSKVLHFKEDGILIYFDDSKKGYITDYKDVTQIIFTYNSITIGTKNGHQNTFRIIEVSNKQLEIIIGFISQSSPSTLLIFKDQPNIVKHFVKELDTEQNNIWIE
ncbi:hypothetical protein [Bernardetia sp.]|uniref:hypothetical protein n=1 Tax=Bernardetia sp. TaxID=1937974 RepID=UPI0025BA2B62|nr:hypothetical protein [Bernardetia sp.]